MSEFGKAFRAARSAGKKTFSWNGKSYTTKLKSETANPSNSPSSQAATSGPPDTKPNAAQAAVDSAPKTSNGSNAKPEQKQDFPKPAVAVGIASAKSPIGQAAARVANTPVPNAPSPVQKVRDYNAQRWADGKIADGKPGDDSDKPEQQGPKPEGVWYAKKGSAVSKAAARRANAPVAKK